jgi:hypothetical protein
MKRIIILVMALMMMLVSIGGCRPWWHDGQGDRHDTNAGHNKSAVPGGPEGSEAPRGHAGSGGAGGGH